MIGSYLCTCKRGFAGNGTYCENIDECERNIHICSEEAYCIDMVGFYTCECWDGYTGNGTVCDDIDECNIDEGELRDGISLNNCHDAMCYDAKGGAVSEVCHADCINNRGSY